ncbi:Acetyltransferase (GNAT) family [uncultured Clostridium sp.]|nr:Acetyltransferase (GNAT) family [uncultured Clostridium sp.]
MLQADKFKVCEVLERMEYIVDDQNLKASIFIPFVNRIWPGEYEMDKTQTALSKTLNITAYNDEVLVGCLRILTDGYFFGTITELLVLPEYQKQGIGSELLRLAGEYTPTMLYFGAQRGAEGFYEKNGCQKSLQSYEIKKER